MKIEITGPEAAVIDAIQAKTKEMLDDHRLRLGIVEHELLGAYTELDRLLSIDNNWNDHSERRMNMAIKLAAAATWIALDAFSELR